MTDRHEDHDHRGSDPRDVVRLRTIRGDPKIFPRSTEVVDSEMYLAVSQVEHLGREVELAQSRLRATIGRHMAAFEELWLKLHELHPEIDPPNSGGAAFLRWREKLYYVSWDDEEPPNE